MKNLLIEQNPHWYKKVYNYVPREKLSQLISYLALKQIITITGIRRCGKSTLAKQAIAYLIKSGVNPLNILFVNLEQPIFLEYRDSPLYLDNIYEEYLKLNNPQGKTYIIFDEIQYFNSWQVYIKSKYESSDIKFIITGSNSSMLSSELATLLSGRALNIHLDTFSFNEFLNYKNVPHGNEIEKISNRIEIAIAKDEYLKWGGFYEVFTAPDETIKKEILISYAKNIIYQDIIPRYNIRNAHQIEKLFFYLLSNATNIINISTLSQIFDISDKSIKEYINYFEDVFLLKRLDRFHNKAKEQIKSAKKIYILDNGFLQIAPKNSNNLGAKLENMVFNLLSQKYDSLYYLKDILEIDFYADDTLYQVSYNIDDSKTKKREISAIENFKKVGKKYKLITYNENDIIGDIEVVSFDEFAI